VGFLGWRKQGDGERSTIRNFKKEGKKFSKIESEKDCSPSHHVVTFQAVTETGAA
jgi:hypothetical protein